MDKKQVVARILKAVGARGPIEIKLYWVDAGIVIISEKFSDISEITACKILKAALITTLETSKLEKTGMSGASGFSIRLFDEEGADCLFSLQLNIGKGECE